MNATEFREIIEIVKRSPSPHNVQPAKWELREDRISLISDERRKLNVSDPEDRDHAISLGAAWFAMKTVLKARGLELEALEPLPLNAPNLIRRRSGKIKETSPSKESLGLLTAMREFACYRGAFAPNTSDAQDLFLQKLVNQDFIKIVRKKEDIQRLAKSYDDLLASFMARRPYAQELYEWTRFDPRSSRYQEDGLNADMLRLSAMERFAAPYIMRPGALKLLGKIGVLKSIISEAAQNKSSTGVCFLIDKKEGDDFELGEKMYRTWLRLWQKGLALCPITTLVDDKDMVDSLNSLLNVPNDDTVKHVFRFGPLPKEANLGLSSRLKTDDIIYKESV